MMPYQPYKKTNQKNLVLAIVLSALLVAGWQMFVEAPKRREMAQWNAAEQQKQDIAEKQAEKERVASAPLPRAELLAQSPRVAIASADLHGSIALKGLRFDDLRLAHYSITQDPAGGEVILLSPQGDAESYFAEIGWLADGGVAVPDEHTLWQADAKTLSPGHPVTLRWDNGQGQTFIVNVALDAHYMFSLTQKVENHGAGAVSLVPYAFINRAYVEEGRSFLYAGPLGVLDGSLSDISYKSLREEKSKSFDNASGWLGITDKYWLTALIPAGAGFKAEFSNYQSHGAERYQVQYTAPAELINAGSASETQLRLFAGAKELSTLDAYEQGNPPIPLFDRSVDFGMFYFLTRPLSRLLTWLHHLTGNLGVAIILLTLIVKLAMVPMADKGYMTSAKMRALQPEIQKLKELYPDDKLKQYHEIKALQKRERISGHSLFWMLCIQVVIFLALNKVLYISTEMRHAPFFGWIHDLSAADPSNLFTLFGLIPLEMPASLHIGLLPALMGVMISLQTAMQPAPPDPAAAKVQKFMPYMLVFMFAGLPSGVVLYSLCSSSFSVVQQWIITRRYNALHPEKPAPVFDESESPGVVHDKTP